MFGFVACVIDMQDDTSGSDMSVDSPRKRQKGVRHPETYTRNVIRNARVCGQEYVNYRGVKTPAKRVRSPCKCPRKCYEQFNDDEKLAVFEVLYKMQSKDEQDIHLQRMIHVENVKTHRPRKADASLREKSFKYHVLLASNKIQVCRTAFCRLYDVSEKRIRRLRMLLLDGKIPHDMRGQSPSGNMIKAEDIQAVHAHIASFPTKRGHYADIKYLNENLSIQKMYELFQEKYPTSRIKYSFYYKYFKENFAYRFGRPQVDTCGVCEELTNKMKSVLLNDNAKRVAAAELIVHKRRANKFYTALKESATLSRCREDTVGLCFDFMQNLDLPKVPVQDMFYLRQLTANTFCVYNMKTGHSQFYLYHEGQAGKGPNVVASFLLDYIATYVPHSVTELHLFSDNCPGQNKNHTLCRVLLALTDTGRFQKIVHHFPLRGHSYLPCDRKFSVIRRPIRRCSRIYTLYELCTLICNAARAGQHTVKLIETSDITDCAKWWPRVYKKNVQSVETTMCSYKNRQYFQISKYHYFEYCGEHKGTVKVSEFIKGLMAHTFYLSKGIQIEIPSPRTFPADRMPIKLTKLKDIRTALSYVPGDVKEFYEDILQWPTTGANEPDSDVE